MLISSLHGVFSINMHDVDHEKLIIKSKNKEALQRIFDEKRIYAINQNKYKFCVSLCKQELAHILIMMIKEIDYADFENFINKINLNADQAFA
ncbi:MAG: hypothetical protein EA341_06690 [Mongoliibacter sp.]|nr:MAG: hypothetical protein EA341_06690 [Mongoliibacter sp.]